MVTKRKMGPIVCFFPALSDLFLFLSFSCFFKPWSTKFFFFLCVLDEVLQIFYFLSLSFFELTLLIGKRGEKNPFLHGNTSFYKH